MYDLYHINIILNNVCKCRSLSDVEQTKLLSIMFGFGGGTGGSNICRWYT